MTKLTKILLLDDDKWFADSLEQTLSDVLSCDIKTVNSPEQVFDLVSSWRPDCMIADMHLGGHNFMSLLNEMQGYPDTRLIRKMILSSSGRSIKQSDLSGYGVAAVLDKADYHINDLINFISGAKELDGDKS